MTGKKTLEDGAGAWDMKSLAKKEKGKMENCQCLQEATAQWVTLSPNQLLTRKHTDIRTERQSVFSHQDYIFIPKWFCQVQWVGRS